MLPSRFTDAVVTATGTVQADALEIADETTVISAGAADTGVRLPDVATGMAGSACTIYNMSGSDKKIYPAVGEKINDIGTNASITITDNEGAVCRSVINASLFWMVMKGTMPTS